MVRLWNLATEENYVLTLSGIRDVGRAARVFSVAFDPFERCACFRAQAIRSWAGISLPARVLQLSVSRAKLHRGTFYLRPLVRFWAGTAQMPCGGNSSWTRMLLAFLPPRGSGHERWRRRPRVGPQPNHVRQQHQ